MLWRDTHKGAVVAIPRKCRFLSAATGGRRYLDYTAGTGGLATHLIAVAPTIASNIAGGMGGSVGESHERESTAHERLHEGAITCAACGVSGNDDVIVTGGADAAVKLWGTARLASARRLDLLATFTGHRAPVTCVDVRCVFVCMSEPSFSPAGEEGCSRSRLKP